MIDTDFLKDMQGIFDTALSIVEKKNQDYAASDDPFANFRGSEFVGVDYKRGILVRILDKIKRVSNLLTNKPKVVDESIEDTLMDTINYSALLLLAIRYDRKSKTKKWFNFFMAPIMSLFKKKEKEIYEDCNSEFPDRLGREE